MLKRIVSLFVAFVAISVLAQPASAQDVQAGLQQVAAQAANNSGVTKDSVTTTCTACSSTVTSGADVETVGVYYCKVQSKLNGD